jgi:hypothetical protein
VVLEAAFNCPKERLGQGTLLPKPGVCDNLLLSDNSVPQDERAPRVVRLLRSSGLLEVLAVLNLLLESGPSVHSIDLYALVPSTSLRSVPCLALLPRVIGQLCEDLVDTFASLVFLSRPCFHE